MQPVPVTTRLSVWRHPGLQVWKPTARASIALHRTWIPYDLVKLKTLSFASSARVFLEHAIHRRRRKEITSGQRL